MRKLIFFIVIFLSVLLIIGITARVYMNNIDACDDVIENLYYALNDNFNIKSLNEVIDNNAEILVEYKGDILINGYYSDVSVKIKKYIEDNKLSLGMSLTYDYINHKIDYGLFNVRLNDVYPLYVNSHIESNLYTGEYSTDISLKKIKGEWQIVKLNAVNN